MTDNTTSLWELYQKGIAYQAQSGLSSIIPKNVRFYEGNQWGKVCKETEGLPRPVINIIKMICRSKKAGILSSPVRILFNADNKTVDVEKFNKFAAYIQKEMQQDRLDKKAIDDAVKKGTYIYHYYWDSEAKGKNGLQEGGLRCEIIDPLNIFFSNPCCVDEQKQKWILIATREDIDGVKAKCDSDVNKELIIADESDTQYDTKEQDDGRLCTVLTRYFRKNGEVYCEKATRTTTINKPFSIAPNLEQASKVLGLEDDAPNNSLPDKDEKPLNSNSLAYYYPIVVGQYEPKENSIFGLSEIEGLIPNQKNINFTCAMQLLNNETMAMGKYIVLPNALQGQEITNEPGQVLIDHSQTGGGIRKLTEQSIHSSGSQLVDELISVTRVVTGASEVMTGEVIGSNMSGSAIAQLQSQAELPIEELRDAFWLVKEKQGIILAQFFKLFYDNGTPFAYKEKVSVRNIRGEVVEKDETIQDIFNGSDYKDVEFSVVVEATSGTKTSVAGDINALDVLLSRGLLDAKGYLTAYPDCALSNKTELIKLLQEKEESEISILRQQNQQFVANIQEMQKQIQEQSKAFGEVQSLMKENEQLKMLLLQLRNEAVNKVQLANQTITELMSKNNQTTKDAEELALMVANGINK